ncbi:TlpA family protein disulfide reductase [Sandaracinobacter sp. RS1-74]|uniref:TlpA family protein disulfide reductase n=1 Tax=Sandaracinobacteroides sayramensis TaxID=2913411 RepID=UPI001EDC89A3|nr:TlpA disulfide reductase family protein [Sandaracinobacteroides sayramensis]MCG2841779.1 TlpA family protein disulfide reductase [Sandaracinobacteroides sayramensis]
MKPALILSMSVLLAACQQQQPSPKAEPQAPQAAEAEPAAAKPGFDRSHAGRPAPALALETNPDGATETIADILRANPGRKLLVNLWATWCAPCLKELPTLDTLAADTKGKLLVVPISQDMEGWRAVSKAFTADRYPNLETRVESGMQFGFELKAKGLPLTILYDEKGQEVWRYAGDRDWASPESRAMLGL